MSKVEASSQPTWFQDVKISENFNNLGTTVGQIANNVNSIANVVKSVGDFRDNSLARAKRWYDDVKASPLDIGKIVMNTTQVVKDFATQNSKQIDTSMTIQAVQDITNQVLNGYSETTNQFINLLNITPGIPALLKESLVLDINTVKNDILGIQSSLVTVLGAKTPEENFVKFQKEEITKSLDSIKKAIDHIFSVISNSGIDPSLLVSVLGGLGALALDPAKAYTEIENFLKGVSLKLLMMNPVTGNLDTLRNEVLRVLSDPSIVNVDSKGNPLFFAAVVFFDIGDDTFGALNVWLSRTIAIVGDHKGTLNNFVKALNSPIASGIGEFVSKQFNDYVTNKGFTLGSDIANFATKMPTDITNPLDTLIKSSNTFLGDLTSPTSPIGSFFNKPKTPTTLSLENLTSGKLLDSVTTGVNDIRSIGDKVSSTGVKVEDLKGSAENKWLDFKSAEDMFKYAGKQIEAVQNIIGDATGVVSGIENIIDLVFKKVQENEKIAKGIIDDVSEESKKKLESIKKASELRFDMLIIPPSQKGGINNLKLSIQEHLSKSSTNSPSVGEGVSMYGTVVLITAPQVEALSFMLNSVLQQFERL